MKLINKDQKFVVFGSRGMVGRSICNVLKKNGECLIIVPFTIKNHQEPFDYNRYTKYYLDTR